LVEGSEGRGGNYLIVSCPLHAPIYVAWLQAKSKSRGAHPFSRPRCGIPLPLRRLASGGTERDRGN
jgi:hypothetical protein